MKRCGRCGETKPLSAFGNNRSQKDGLQRRCRACAAVTDKGRYSQEKQVRQQRRQRILERNSRIAWEALQSGCVDCGSKDPWLLEFDHLGDKDGCISELVSSAGVERLRREIAKCEVRCTRCHRIKTAITYTTWRSVLIRELTVPT